MIDIKNDDPYMTLREAARHANVDRQAIYAAIRAGKLKADKVDWKSAMRWRIKKSDLENYRKNKYNPEKRLWNGERLIDIENNRWSILYASKTLSLMLNRPVPIARIYYLIRTGQVQAKKQGFAWVLTKECIIDIYKKEGGVMNEQQLSFA